MVERALGAAHGFEPFRRADGPTHGVEVAVFGVKAVSRQGLRVTGGLPLRGTETRRFV